MEEESDRGGIALNIAMIHFRVGETDGVSLEMDKWKKILENNGHNVIYIAGSEGTSKAFIIKEMYYRDEYDAMLNRECFEQLEQFDEQGLKRVIIEQSNRIEKQFIELFLTHRIDLVIPNNVLCLARSPHVGMALTHAIIKTGVKVVAHHHDFYWERACFSKPTTNYVAHLLDVYFPPIHLKDMKHVVINNPAKKDLFDKKGIESKVVPNVFDFDHEPWVEDGYNATYKKDLGVHENQLIFLQATRVTNRKSIELAVDLVAMLNEAEYRKKLIGKTLYNGKKFEENTEIVIALIGLHEGGNGYEEKLIQYAKDKNVKMLVKPELVNHARCMVNGSKVYALWDAYVYCDIITYPSIYEGWGNQFLEGLFAKKPQIVFEYSVFESDIKDYGFQYISLGNTYETKDNGLVKIEDSKLKEAANETINYLTNKTLYEQVVEDNYQIGEKYLSLTALEVLIMPLFE